MQRIERIEPGSIDIVSVLLVISSAITIIEFVQKAANLITNKIMSECEQDLRGTRRDKKVYYRNEVTINNSEQSSSYIDKSSFAIHIHIHNENDIGKVTESLQLIK